MEDRYRSLRRQIQILALGWVILAGAIAFHWFSNTYESGSDILRAKGLVIEDARGNPRLLLGYPLPEINGRLRTDTLEGLVMLDESGMDRIHLGKHGKLYLGEKYHDRDNDGYSLFFNDQKGEERSGYGFSDSDNSVGLGMDYGGANGGEAIYLYAAPGIAFMTLNADLQDQPGIRDRIVLWHETESDLSLLKLSDSKKDGQVLLRTHEGIQTTQGISVNY